MNRTRKNGEGNILRTLIACTQEIDNVELAVKELLEQLDLAQNLRQNSVGIIACHYEFVFSGVVEALCAQLPFDVAGTITSAQAVADEAGTLLLTLMVLTSDQEHFRAVRSASLIGNPSQTIATAYAEAAAGFSERPALVFAFAGFMVENSGDEYVQVITDVSKGAPCFGTLSVDDTADFRHCYMLFNGKHYRESMAMVLVYGAITPKFYIGTISEDKIMARAALVTSSEGHILKEVNNQPVVEYFKDLGLAKASETGYAMTSLPFMLDYGDGTPPVSKVFIGLNEWQQAICAGAMPEGSSLYLGVFDKEDVLKTTEEAVQRALDEVDTASVILIYSCISRSMALGGDLFAELDLVKEIIGQKYPFMMVYSGGEICSTKIREDQAINRFHNNAFVLCVF